MKRAIFITAALSVLAISTSSLVVFLKPSFQEFDDGFLEEGLEFNNIFTTTQFLDIVVDETSTSNVEVEEEKFISGFIDSITNNLVTHNKEVINDKSQVKPSDLSLFMDAYKTYLLNDGTDDEVKDLLEIKSTWSDDDKTNDIKEYTFTVDLSKLKDHLREEAFDENWDNENGVCIDDSKACYDNETIYTWMRGHMKNDQTFKISWDHLYIIKQK